MFSRGDLAFISIFGALIFTFVVIVISKQEADKAEDQAPYTTNHEIYDPPSSSDSFKRIITLSDSILHYIELGLLHDISEEVVDEIVKPIQSEVDSLVLTLTDTETVIYKSELKLSFDAMLDRVLLEQERRKKN